MLLAEPAKVSYVQTRDTRVSIFKLRPDVPVFQLYTASFFALPSPSPPPREFQEKGAVPVEQTDNLSILLICILIFHRLPWKFLF